jgi:hypothetical protein
MPTPTYTLIDSVTLTSSASSVSFTGISAAGKGDLVLVATAYGSSAGITQRIIFNGDTGANYNSVFAYGNGSSNGSGSKSAFSYLRVIEAGGLSSDPSIGVIQVADFSATDKQKSVLVRADSAGANAATEMIAGRWASTSAITSILVYLSAGNYLAGSTFFLYQIVSE